MGFMQRFERKLENAVGNTFARVFGGEIVPAEVEDALHREAARGLQNLDGHELAPNQYVLTVSESDEQNLTADTELTLNAFAKHLSGYIDEQGWETYGVVTVALESSPDLHTGQFRARSVIAPDDEAPQPSAPQPNAPQPRAPQPNASAPAPAAFPHPRPGAAQMPSEQHDAPPNRYQPQAYSADQYQEPQYQDSPYQEQQYGEQQYQRPQYDGEQRYAEPQYREHQYQEQQYQEPEPPAQAYSERPQPGQNFPHQQRYGGEQHADPRFQPPAHLYPPRQPAPRPPAPQNPAPQQPQQPPYQQPVQYSQPGYGYQDQAYAGQEYPLRDPSSDYYADDRFDAPGAPQQEWSAHVPKVVLELSDGSGRNLELRHGSNIIGRGQDAHFRIPDTGVSRQHADIQWDGAVALIVDLQSTNGTVVNDTAVNEWQLADGDVIRVGHSDITVRFH